MPETKIDEWAVNAENAAIEISHAVYLEPSKRPIFIEMFRGIIIRHTPAVGKLYAEIAQAHRTNTELTRLNNLKANRLADLTEALARLDSGEIGVLEFVEQVRRTLKPNPVGDLDNGNPHGAEQDEP